MLQRLTILGTGTIIPLPGRKCASYLLETGEGLMLFDCGPGTLIQLSSLGMDFSAIKYFFLSHFHLDHVSDLFAVILSRWLRGLPDNDRIYITGPEGTRDMITNAKKYFFANEKWFLPEKITVNELTSGSLAIGNLEIKTLPTNHTENSICYRVEDKSGKSFFYSGDTDYNENIIALCDRSDISVIECSHSGSSGNSEGHMTFSKLLKVARQVKTKRMILSHFYQDFFADGGREKTEGKGNITIAEDFDTFTFT